MMLQLPTSTEIMTSPPIPAEDTTFARISRHQEAGEQAASLAELEERRCRKAEKTLGAKPFALIAWRHYSAIGICGIEACRRELLARDADPKVVQREYLDAKRRYKKREAECRQWRKAAGVEATHKKMEALVQERWAIIDSFSDDPPRSAKAASALIFYLLKVYDGSDFDDRAIGCLQAIADALSTVEDRLPHQA